jgi:hypothetical protein
MLRVVQRAATVSYDSGNVGVVALWPPVGREIEQNDTTNSLMQEI